MKVLNDYVTKWFKGGMFSLVVITAFPVFDDDIPNW